MDLLEENTGRKVDRQRLTRLRRARDSDSPEPALTSKSRAPARALESGDESDHRRDVDHIWDEDDRLPAAGDRLDDEDVDMDDFIDDDMEEDEGLAEEEREERRRERKRVERERNRALGARPELTGIDATYVLCRLLSNICSLFWEAPGMRFMRCLAMVQITIGRSTTTSSLWMRRCQNMI